MRPHHDGVEGLRLGREERYLAPIWIVWRKDVMARLAALDHARMEIGASVAPLLALEALMAKLARGA